MTKTKGRKPPEGLRPSAQALWDEVHEHFQLFPHEETLLVEVVRIVDRLDQLEEAVSRDGVLVKGKPHPALVEARQQQIVLGRLLVSLRLPEDWSKPNARPQRRGAARGSYGSRELRALA